MLYIKLLIILLAYFLPTILTFVIKGHSLDNKLHIFVLNLFGFIFPFYAIALYGALNDMDIDEENEEENDRESYMVFDSMTNTYHKIK